VRSRRTALIWLGGALLLAAAVFDFVRPKGGGALLPPEKGGLTVSQMKDMARRVHGEMSLLTPDERARVLATLQNRPTGTPPPAPKR